MEVGFFWCVDALNRCNSKKSFGDGQQEAETNFKAHLGPVWQVAWAHPLDPPTHAWGAAAARTVSGSTFYSLPSPSAWWPNVCFLHGKVRSHVNVERAAIKCAQPRENSDSHGQQSDHFACSTLTLAVCGPDAARAGSRWLIFPPPRLAIATVRLQFPSWSAACGTITEPA